MEMKERVGIQIFYLFSKINLLWETREQWRFEVIQFTTSFWLGVVTDFVFICISKGK